MKLKPLTVKDLNETDIIIAIMGPTGVGKSTFIDIATKQDGKNVGHSLQSCTANIRAVRVNHPRGGNRPVVFVDTPGFDDTIKSDAEVLTLIADWLKQTYEGDIKLNGIIYLHRISDNRMTGSALKNLKVFGNLCGDEAIRNVILATTMWSPLEDYIAGSKGEKELRHEKELCDKYWKAMIDRGARIARFLRTYDSAWTIVDLISVINPPNPLLLQEEMVDLKKEIWETHAAITLYDMLQKELANQRDTVKKLQKEAEMQDNAQLVRELNLQREEIEMTLRATSAQIRELKIPIGRQFLSLFSVKKTRARVLHIWG